MTAQEMRGWWQSVQEIRKQAGRKWRHAKRYMERTDM
jgi:hypothetical protein